MKLREIFGKQLTETRIRKAKVFFYVFDGKALNLISMSMWRIGALLETHTYKAKDQVERILPVFREK